MPRKFEKFEFSSPDERGPVEADKPTDLVPEIIYVDVPDENAPIVADSSAGAIGMMGIYATLRKGNDVRIPSLNITFRSKDTSTKPTIE